jgi:hypothetical protein
VIQGREVTMEKDQQAAVLTLPEPGGQSGEVRLMPVNAVKIPARRNDDSAVRNLTSPRPSLRIFLNAK